MQTFDDEIQRLPEEGPNTVALFLGLYLVILAFFILLVTISTIEENRSKKVMDSLSSTFTSIVPPSANLMTLNRSAEEGVLAGQEFQQQITGIFATELGISKVDTLQPGRQMRLMLKSDSLFFQGEARIRSAMYPLLDRTVAALSNRPAGQRFDMEFVIGTAPSADGKTLPTTETLAIKRAGAFANEMNSRGIPPDSIAVGVRPGREGDVAIYFYTRDVEKSKLNFTQDER
ncbi:hypothetical protein V5T82_07900 [Magnetovibrio sp. PR-2]|uniref:hypothetical protein n=1 Tax=Magnetovibrio sp. PR-2 TaxID=3120356 RepID=UPI002FCE3AB5